MPAFVGHNTYFWEVTIAMKGESLFLVTGVVRSQWEKKHSGIWRGRSQSVGICEVREKERKISRQTSLDTSFQHVLNTHFGPGSTLDGRDRKVNENSAVLPRLSLLRGEKCKPNINSFMAGLCLI